MRALSVETTRASRPWLTFLAAAAVGLAILVVTQVLSVTRLELGPWALNGNGALAVPFVGFPLAIYAGWTLLADRYLGRDLVVQLVAFSVGLTLGAWVLGILFGLPVALATGAVCAIWMRGTAVKRSDTLLWIAFAASVALGALPILGLFGVALLPGSLILIARDKSTAARIALGALLVAATMVIVFVVPVLFPAPAPTA
ncbi:MAG TPA: hypothetical protein VF001_00795 [Candidatus Limnocylindria bacterium]